MKKVIIWICLCAIIVLNSKVDSWAYAATCENVESYIVKNTLTAEELIENNIVSEDELKEGEILLGGIEGDVYLDTEENITSARVITGVAHIRSYATYSKTEGVSVYVKLYAPWYTFTNPKFTMMCGYVTCVLGDESQVQGFSEVANETETISKTVDIGMTAKSGTTGTVSVAGVATGTNIATYAGEFSISYDVEIP